MWILSNISQADCEYNLLVDQEYQVGRKDCPILITGDSSISRKHAVLKVSHIEPNLGDHRKLPILTVQDLSKFGTLVGDQKVKGQAILKNNDVITFGAMGSKWKVHYQPLVVTSSMLDASLKRKLKQLLLKLGSHLVTEWHKECTHLVMSSVKVTVKTISAMVCCKPIVLPTFFQKMLEAASSRTQMPDPEDFQPPVAETTINPNEVTFKSNRERRTLFKKLKFIFFTPKQLKHLGQVINMGGGETVLMETPPPDWKNTLLGEGVVVLSCDAGTVTDPQQQKWIRDSTSFLTKNARRTVQESEIGLAVLHSSVDAYCNPEIDPGCLLFQSQAIPSQSLSQGAEVYVSNTESSQSQGPVPSGRSVITDSNVSGQSQMPAGTSQQSSRPKKATNQKNTLMSYFGPSSSKKRAREDVEATENSEAKQRRIEDSTEITETPHTSMGISEKNIRIKQERSPSPTTCSKSVAGTSEVDTKETRPPKQETSVETKKAQPHKVTSVEAKKNQPMKVKVERSPPRKPMTRQMEGNGSSDEEEDLFGHGPKRERRRQEIPGWEDDDPFEVKASNRETKETRSKVVEERGQGEGVVSSHGNRKRQKQQEFAGSESDDPFEMRPSKKEAKEAQSEVVEEMGQGEGVVSSHGNRKRPRQEEEEDEEKPTSATRNGDTATRVVSERNTTSKINLDMNLPSCGEVEEDQPSNLTTVDVVSLVVRKARPVQPRYTEETDDPNKTPVKNFKKFRKVPYVGMERGLPRIIGGTDLVVHVPSRVSNEMHNFWLDEMEDESQRAKAEEEEDDLFKFDFKKTRKR
ncbi:nibrin-like isoform X2 [Branchiostoma floridae]|uniref:Nibrin n=1 Tax=Branchiostoma floridae TaxID=7739 RepID=A0A9J7MRX2_BRAFL|nr:nibrin-like isoform X2 [Branchiostoma floridae]